MQLLAGTDVIPRLISNRPQEWRLGRLTVVIAKAGARLRYAREPIGRAPPRADEIVAAWRRALARLELRSLAPDELLPKLATAYRAIASAGNARVLLVTLRDELSYGRAQFAWDLARLRRERRLSFEGQRVDIGVATGSSTSKRSRVVWIEDDGGGGGFYETLRLMEVRP